MALTNAERQRRYRQKLKARASGEAAGELVRAMVDRAIAVLWRTQAAASPENALIVPGFGTEPAAIQPLDAFRASLGRHPAGFLPMCRATLQGGHDLAEDERALLANLLDVEAALRPGLPSHRPARRGTAGRQIHDRNFSPPT